MRGRPYIRHPRALTGKDAKAAPERVEVVAIDAVAEGAHRLQCISLLQLPHGDDDSVLLVLGAARFDDGLCEPRQRRKPLAVRQICLADELRSALELLLESAQC